MIVLGLVALVGEVDEELGITLDDYALDPESNCSSEPGEEAFVFSDVVGDLVLRLEAELHGVVELSPVGEVSTTPAPAPFYANAPSKFMVQWPGPRFLAAEILLRGLPLRGDLSILR